jgi:hypothetical protein
MDARRADDMLRGSQTQQEAQQTASPVAVTTEARHQGAGALVARLRGRGE